MKWVDAAYRYASEGSIERGEDYVRTGRIRDLFSNDGKVSSSALGSNGELYSVRLSESFFDCSCPYGQKGEYCKHLVATAYLADGDGLPGEEDDSTAVAEAEEQEPDTELDRLKKQIEAALAVTDFDPSDYSYRWDDDWDIGYDYANQIREAIQLIDRASKESITSVEQLEAIQHILTEVSASMTDLRFDLSCVGDALDEVAAVHLEVALQLADGVNETERTSLARFIFWNNFESSDYLSWMHIYDYALPLREIGIEHLEKVVVAKLNELDESCLSVFDEDMAICRKDMRAIINLFGGSLSNCQSYNAVISALRKAGFRDEALFFARQGFAKNIRIHWNDRKDFDHLADYLIADAAIRDDGSEIVRIRWEVFSRNVSFEYYKQLKKAAEDMGVWNEYKGDAEALLATDRREYFAFLHYEKRSDELWGLFSREGPAVLKGLSLESVLGLRCSTHPEDTVEYYKAAVFEESRETRKWAYKRQCELLKLLRRATMLAVEKGALDDMASYDAFVEHMLEVNKRRPACLQEYRKQKIIS